MSGEAHIAAPLVRQLVDAFEVRGIERDRLLEQARIPPGALGLMRLRLPFSMVEDLFEAAETLSGDDRIGFHMSEWRDLDVVGLPAMLMVASGTMRDAIYQAERFAHLWSTAYQIELCEDPGGLQGRLVIRRPERRGLVHLREMLMADGLRMVRHIARRDAAAVEVRLPHVRTGDLSEYEEYFQCPVRFGMGETVIVLAHDVLDMPLPTASSMLLELFERQASDELQELSARQGVAERVRAVLEEDLEQQRLSQASVEQVATRLRASGRTLQRMLGKEGTSFGQELETVRRKAAETMLLAGADIAEVSWRLGYAEPAVFHRAFKRWTGQTPERFRQQQA